jgi:hypothetical protein
MLADLDLLLIAVFCTADDLLPGRAENARRRITDAEVVTLCVAQAIMGLPSMSASSPLPPSGSGICSRSDPSGRAIGSAGSA